MRHLFFLLANFSIYLMVAQINCSDLRTTGVQYTLTASKNGKGKLFPTDPEITNQFKYASFKLTLVSELDKQIQDDIKKYKFPLVASDSVILYDWDILHQANMGYFGPAVGKVKFNCKDSTLYIYKYVLKPETKNYVPTRFKIIRMGKDNFIILDIDHPYLNLNYYFKKEN